MTVLQGEDRAARTSRSLREGRVAAISRLSAVDTVRARVMVAINLGLLAPEARLPAVDEMAEAFDVSRSSVVRGLSLLQKEGVIVRRTGRYGGSFVGTDGQQGDGTPVQAYLEDYPTVHTLIDERAVLESGFAALAARERREPQVVRMRELVEAMAVTESWAEFRNLDRAFHNLVAEAAHTPLALPILDRVNKALDPYFIPYRMELLHSSNLEHGEVVEALAAHDAGRAATLTADHVQELHSSMYVGLQ